MHLKTIEDEIIKMTDQQHSRFVDESQFNIKRSIMLGTLWSFNETGGPCFLCGRLWVVLLQPTMFKLSKAYTHEA